MTNKQNTRKLASAIVLQRTPHVATGELVQLHGQPAAKLLYTAFEKFNAQFFGGNLGAPLVLITNAKSARTLGDYIARDVHGLESRIRIAPKAVDRGVLFCLDVLLHEMVHAWQEEIEEDGEGGYRGHGPKFAAKCTEIGAVLGLGAVGVKGRDGLPDCKSWPMNVRPEGYYPEEFKAPKRQKKEKTPAEPSEPSEPSEDSGFDVMATVERLLSSCDLEELQTIAAMFEQEIASRLETAEAAE